MNVSNLSQLLAANAHFYAPLIMKEQPSQKTGNTLRFRKNHSLSVYISGAKRGKWMDFSADRHGDLLDLIQEMEGVNLAQAIDIAKDLLGITENTPLPAPSLIQDPIQEDIESQEKRIRIAQWLWQQSISPNEGIIGYLKHRGLKLDPLMRGRQITSTILREKMHIDTKNINDENVDIAVFPLTLSDGTLRAVQQIFIHRERKAPFKAPKRTNGVPEKAAIRFGKGPLVILCEGPETGLSIHQATKLPVFAATGRAFLPRIELGQDVKEVWVAIDDDEPGRDAGQKTIENIRSQSKKTRIITPPRLQEKTDFNDVLRILGPDAVRSAFNL